MLEGVNMKLFELVVIFKNVASKSSKGPWVQNPVMQTDKQQWEKCIINEKKKSESILSSSLLSTYSAGLRRVFR
jgi:hypothetical protein